MGRIEQRGSETVSGSGAGSSRLCPVPGPARAQARDAKPLKGLGSGVPEVVSRYDGDTYRAAYTVRFKAAVYVLHAFQTKAKRGAETPRPDTELVRNRLRTAEQHYAYAYGEE